MDQQQQPYDSSYYAYYHPQQYPNYYQQHQDYANYYNQQQFQSQLNSSPIRPPGVSTPQPESSNPVAPSSDYAQIHHDFQYYPPYQQPQFHPQRQYHMGFGRSERPLHKGHRKWGGKSFMRGGHAALTHGRGHEWSNGQGFRPHSSASTASNLAHAGSTPSPGEPLQASLQPPLASGTGMAPFPTQAHASSAPIWPPRTAWCELCRVDCNTFEILEQHKNGKKHKKKELQNMKKAMTGSINEQMLVPISIIQPNAVQPNSEAVDLKQGSPGKLPVEDSKCDKASIDDTKGERDQQKDLPELQNPVAEMKQDRAGEQKMDHPGARGRGFKRHLRGRQGAKRMRTNKWHRRQAEAPKPKEVISLTCELCNVKCESQVVFDSHLAGKKHLSKLKRFHGNQPILGNGGLQAIFSTNPNTPSLNPAQIDQQTLLGCQNFLVQLVQHILPRATATAFAPTAAPVQANASASEPPLALASESASGTHQQRIPNGEVSEVFNVAPLQAIPPDLPIKDPPASQSQQS
ncbi:hypothetical protein RJ641_016227 [Dillenia turbinata]|uniref:U1-type domain-containing protein n=1 Tax=Dillenia turbinata TaxID=194707 RepID=A0AAN8V2Q0_9MAGN